MGMEKGGSENPELLIIGSMTHSFATYDEGVKERYGGGVAYGGRTAGILGIPTEVITIGAEDIEPGADEIRSYGIKVKRVERNESNNFSNDYRQNRRQLRVSSHITKPMELGDFEDAPNCEGVIFFPGLHEISGKTAGIFEGKTVFLDVAGLTRIIGEKDEEGLNLVSQGHWDTIDEYRNKVDVLKVSHEDLENIEFVEGIETDEEKMQNLADNGFPIVLFTKGEEGTVLARKNMPITKISSYKVEGDPAGAGEVFSVGFMAEYLESKDPVKAAAFGSACASYKIAGEEYDYNKAEERANQILGGQ